MPSKNRVKQYVTDSIYHCYNRGVEKRIIFLEKVDYLVFLSYLKEYLSPIDKRGIQNQLSDLNIDYKKREKLVRQLEIKNYADRVSLLAYCLMPNHFHLLLYQTDGKAIQEFMQSLMTRFTMYINKKYNRVGPLFQGVYKGVLVISDEQLVHLSYYIHAQAILNSKGQTLRVQKPSSLPNYLGQINQLGVKPERILSWFDQGSSGDMYSSYQEFMSLPTNKVALISELLLE